MKRTVSIVLRLLLAVAGISFIVWTLSFEDTLTIPAGFELANGQRVARATTLTIVHQDAQFVTVQVEENTALQRQLTPLGQPPVPTVSFTRTEIGDGPEELHVSLGIVTLLRQSRGGLLLLGFLFVAPVLILQSLRWWLLLRARGIVVPYRRAFDLTMVGMFFNFCMPGSTGGDVVKAYYAAKGSGARTTTIMSVIMDRAVGLFGLVLLGAVAGVALLLDPDAPMIARKAALVVSGVLFACVAGSACYFSHRVRRLSGVERLLARWSEDHWLNKIDQAAHAYRHHMGTLALTIAMSVMVHLCIIAAMFMAGRAMGIDHSYGVMLVVLPVLMLAGVVPLTYQGLGIMEGLGLALLAAPGLATANQIVAMLMVSRLYMLTYALLGTLILLRGDIHMFPANSQPAQEQAVDPAV